MKKMPGMVNLKKQNYNWIIPIFYSMPQSRCTSLAVSSETRFGEIFGTLAIFCYYLAIFEGPFAGFVKFFNLIW